MNNCSKCKKDKALAFFLENNKKFKTCNVCRNQSRIIGEKRIKK